MLQVSPPSLTLPSNQLTGALARFSINGIECVVMALDSEGMCAENCLGSLVIAGQRYGIFCEHQGRAASDPVEVLTPRELEIALLIAAGYEAKAVARRLRISFHTVRVHVARIYAKLGLHKQTELAARMGARFGRL